ncbi:hypothetical protein B0T10DRAFT_488090 [Thelonectria olida]|uniref:Uncharacterized protein n=1 Tax=Thelonectria olida TaxID=1576542 RepID=A0A9P8W235_9HYPO|nr:hypothetical protein B0T10DRAFT_488090 [Thelonectria olida]
MSHPAIPKDEKPSPWLPTVMNNADKSVFLMDATHRGDMYHMRAAMQLFNYSLCLYNCSKDTKDLEDYLKRSVAENKKHVFLVPWTSEVLYGQTRPTSTQMQGCTLDGKTLHPTDLQQYKNSVFSENRATSEVLKRAIKQKGLPKAVSDGMAILTPASLSALNTKFGSLFKGVWDKNKPTILGMYRKTGTVAEHGKPPGVYPELDTGNTLTEIASILPDRAGKKLRIVSCGNQEKLPGIPDDIGQYWLAFKDVKLDPKDCKRDAEAYFLNWAFEKGYYEMATGFRSGPLDLFTFLGIPTVSIGLCHMVGEFRHARLARELFKRVNIQYNQPRHIATAYFQPEREDTAFQMASPFWLKHPTTGAERAEPADKDKEQREPPGDFAAFDKTVIKVGYSLACEKYVSATKTIELLKPKILDVINSRVARYCYPANLAGDENEAQRIAYFKAQKGVDLKDMETMGKDLIRYQETPTVFGEKYETPWKEDWKDIFTELGQDEDS